MYRPTTKIVIYPQPNSSGLHSISLRITYLRQTKYYSIGITCKKSDWASDFSRLLKTHEGHREDNERLSMLDKRAKDILIDWERDNTPFSFSAFKKRFFNIVEKKQAFMLHEWMQQIAKDFESQDNPGNASFYADVADRVEAFKTVEMSLVDTAWVKSFEAHLVKTGCGKGGASVYLRTIRAACNKAIADKLLPKSWYPFDGYSLSHLKTDRKEGNAGKSLTEAELLKIQKVELQGGLALARDLFMFSFFNRGMNLSDIARITKSQVSSDRLKYTRKKTKRLYSVRITEKSREIADLYAASSQSDYIFPIFSGKETTEKEKRMRIKYSAKTINTNIRKVCVLVGINPKEVIFYSARHSYATILKNKGVNVRVIQEALGHSTLNTTENYLKSFDDSVIDSADELLLS